MAVTTELLDSTFAVEEWVWLPDAGLWFDLGSRQFHTSAAGPPVDDRDVPDRLSWHDARQLGLTPLDPTTEPTDTGPLDFDPATMTFWNGDQLAGVHTSLADQVHTTGSMTWIGGDAGMFVDTKTGQLLDQDRYVPLTDLDPPSNRPHCATPAWSTPTAPPPTTTSTSTPS